MDVSDSFNKIVLDNDMRPGEIIYQVYPSSFNDSNNDGWGDLKGIIARLDYIKNSGADAIWVSPYYLSPEGPDGDGGYAVSDYRTINPIYGTMEDFEELVSEVHKRGLRLYSDMVHAHTANNHEWFEKSRQKDKDFKDHYVWHPGSSYRDGQVHHDGDFENGSRVPPNNWKSVFGGPAWHFDETRQEYYLHHFLKSQPALNLNEEHVQDAILEEMKFWLDKGLDGFRIDALPFSNYDSQLRNNPWIDRQPDEFWNQQYFEHSMCQPQTIDFVARIRALADSYQDKKTTLGEVICGRHGGFGAIDVAATYIDKHTGLDMCYTDLGLAIVPATDHDTVKHVITEIQNRFPHGGHCISISNHDFVRSRTLAVEHLPEEEQEAALRQNMKIIMTIPGSIVLYQGEELGLPQARIPEDIPLDKLKDPVAQTRGPEHCRDGSRTPMPWESNEKNAGFTKADTPYLPVPPSHLELAADVQENDPDSMLNFTRDLIKWRKEQPALVSGKIKVLSTHAPVLAFVREHNDQTMLFCYNRSNKDASFKPADFLDQEMLKKLGLDDNATISLKPYDDCNVNTSSSQTYNHGNDSQNPDTDITL